MGLNDLKMTQPVFMPAVFALTRFFPHACPFEALCSKEERERRGQTNEGRNTFLFKCGNLQNDRTQTNKKNLIS